MTMKAKDAEQMEKLRKRRLRLAENRKKREKKAQYGRTIISKVNSALGTQLSGHSFIEERHLPINFDRQPNFADCSGLVAAHRSEGDIRAIVECCDRKLGPVSGIVGFDDYSFMGTAEIAFTQLGALLDAAKSLHDSVMFCPNNIKGIILIDHYKVSGITRDCGFSIVIQGQVLESKLAKCFENVTLLKG